MTYVVLDTNVLMSAIFFGGLPFEILSAWHDGRIAVVVSSAVMSEYREIGDRLRKKFPSVNPTPWLDYGEAHAVKVRAKALAVQVCEDPDDDVFLACANASAAKIICSGDKLLLKCDGWNGIEVITPRKFVDRHLTETRGK